MQWLLWFDEVQGKRGLTLVRVFFCGVGGGGGREGGRLLHGTTRVRLIA